jgi:hypothetical protein
MLLLLLEDKSNPEATFMIAQDLFTILDSFNLKEGTKSLPKEEVPVPKSSVMINFKLKLCLR